MKEEPRAPGGIDWRMVAQTIGIGLVVWLAVTLFNQIVQSIRVLIPLPAAYVAVISYFRSRQRTRGQAVAEAIFAGCISAILVYILLPAIILLFPTE